MKNVILRSLALAIGVVGFMSSQANAQEAAVSDSDSGKFTPMLNIEAHYALLDTTRKTAFDFPMQRFRAGAKYHQGNFSALGEVEFLGNSYGEYANGLPNSSSSLGQTVGIRQAYASYKAMNNENYGSGTFYLGRFIPTGANIYGNDFLNNTYSISGFYPEDGVMFEYSQKYGNLDLTAQLAVVNSMQVLLYSSGATLSQNTWLFSSRGGTVNFTGNSTYDGNGGGDFNSTVNADSNAASNSLNKAYIATVSASTEVSQGTVEAVGAYGIKNEAIGNTVINSNVSGSSSITARDLQYIEASVGYNYQKNLQFGLWYSLAMASAPRPASDMVNAGNTQFGTESGSSDNYSIAGVGIQGNSKMFGLTNILAKDDMFTFSGGAQTYMRRQTGRNSMSDGDAAKNDVVALTAGAGYKQNKFYTELDAAWLTASNSVFRNNGNNNLTSTMGVVYAVVGVQVN